MLKELIFWQKVYAQNVIPKPSPNSDVPTIEEIDASLVPIQQKFELLNKQYGSFFANKEDSQWNWLCFKDNVNKDSEDLIRCSALSNDKLTQSFCLDTNDLVWQNVSTFSSSKIPFIQNSNGIWWCACPNGYVQSWWIDIDECLINGTDNLGIQCDAQQLINGTCSWNINKTLGVRTSETTPNPTVLLQDVVLAATSFVWTMIMIALIVMWVKYVQWWFDEWANGDLKGNIKKLLIWLFLVIGSYTIIRLVQYVARGY